VIPDDRRDIATGIVIRDHVPDHVLRTQAITTTCDRSRGTITGLGTIIWRQIAVNMVLAGLVIPTCMRKSSL
jgi:hypothetical protein